MALPSQAAGIGNLPHEPHKMRTVGVCAACRNLGRVLATFCVGRRVVGRSLARRCLARVCPSRRLRTAHTCDMRLPREQTPYSRPLSSRFVKSTMPLSFASQSVVCVHVDLGTPRDMTPRAPPRALLWSHADAFHVLPNRASSSCRRSCRCRRRPPDGRGERLNDAHRARRRAAPRRRREFSRARARTRSRRRGGIPTRPSSCGTTRPAGRSRRCTSRRRCTTRRRRTTRSRRRTTRAFGVSSGGAT